MNVFVLCTGRCGSTTFIKACSHIRNFTTGHETRAGEVGDARFAYPDHHIEADNRLAWFLGRLESQLRSRPQLYVRLIRDPEATAQSFLRRYGDGIIGAYASHILMRRRPEASPLDVCRDYVNTVTQNIESFLRAQRGARVVTVEIDGEAVAEQFAAFWLAIDARGELGAALSELKVHYNASEGVA